MRGQIGLRPRARQNGRVLQRILQRFCEVILGGGSDGLNARAGAFRACGRTFAAINNQDPGHPKRETTAIGGVFCTPGGEWL